MSLLRKRIIKMKISQIQEARESSGIEDWGAGYFGIDLNGSVVCYPNADENHPAYCLT